MRLASRFGRINQIRRDRPLTHEELMSHVPACSVVTNMNLGQTGTPTSRPSPSLKAYSVKALSRSLPARRRFGTRASGSTPNTCFACVVPVNCQDIRCRKSFYLTAMTAHQATRCCRGYFEASVPMVWSAASHSEKCGYRIKAMSSRR